MTDFFYLKKYLREHKYYHFEEKIILELESHPDYPSLAAIVDVFNYYDIENIAARIDQSDLMNLPKTYLSVFSTHTGNEIVYTKKTGNDFEIQFANGFVQKLSRAKYLEGWNGMIVAIEENENSNKEQNSIISGNLGLFLIGTICLALFHVYWLNSSNPILPICYTVTAIAGLLISVFLVREDLGFQDDSISKICHATKKTSCKEVLSSNNAKVFGNLKLSDISLIYFSVLTAFSTFTLIQDTAFVYSCLALLSIPVLLYSLFAQYFIVKKWCVLCLGIASVLAMQIALILIYGFDNFSFLEHLKNTATFFAILILSTIVWMELKSLIKNNLIRKNSELKYHQLKRKYAVFKGLLNDDQSVNTHTLERLEAITIGNENVPVTFYAVLSASCGHCHKAYENLMKLLARSEEQVNVKLIFNINIDNYNNPYNGIYQQIMNYYLLEDYSKVNAALQDWHIERTTLEDWKSKWKFKQSEQASAIIQEQYNWCLENKVFHTPAIILNGQLLPKEYDVNELNFFIDRLIEEKNLVF